MFLDSKDKLVKRDVSKVAVRGRSMSAPFREAPKPEVIALLQPKMRLQPPKERKSHKQSIVVCLFVFICNKLSFY